MCSWFFVVCLHVLVPAQDYVCNQANFRRMVGNVQIKVESYYSRVVVSSSEIADTLSYSSAHPNYFPGVYRVSDLTPCNSTPDQFSLAGTAANRLLGIHVLNRTSQGVKFNFDLIEEELAFVTPITNFLPSILSHNPDASVIYVAGITLNCSTFYFYPYRDVCGLLPMMDICDFYNKRYNLFSKAEELQSDYENGGHWSDVYADSKGNLVITYSFPVKDAQGVFRAQVGLGVGTKGVSQLVDQSKPSQNGFTFIMNAAGHVIYASQPVIDILFGANANLSLRKISSSYTGAVRNVAISLQQAETQFSALPQILEESETNGSTFMADPNLDSGGYYVAWSRFEETLRTWFLIGLVPKFELDSSAVWNITPPTTEISLTEENPSAQILLSASNNGMLPLTFYVDANHHSRGILINTSTSRYVLPPNATRQVKISIALDPSETEALSFTTHLVTPFYASSSGYGACFKPQVAEIIINVVRQAYYVPTRWASMIIFLLCGVTGPLILGAYVLLFCYRYSPPVLALAPRLICLILLGLLFLLCACVVNMLAPTPLLCELMRWLFHVGFTLTLSTIIAKNYRNRLIFTSKKLQVVALSDYKLMAFVAVCVLVDAIIILAGNIAEPYTISVTGHCTLANGWVSYAISVITKIVLWVIAFWNTLRISNIPSTFADTRLNGVLVLVVLMALIRMGLQFANALDDKFGIQLFLGSLFTWVSAFLVCGHYLLKLRSGYVTVPRPRSSTKNASISLSLTQPKLKDRLETLLLEIEAQSTRLLADKNNAIENVKANQRLMFEVRAELLAINTQAHLVDEELERFLPSSIKTAFDKFGPAMARRLGPPPKARVNSKAEAEARPLQSPVTVSSQLLPSTTEDPRDILLERPRLESFDENSFPPQSSTKIDDCAVSFHFPTVGSLKETETKVDEDAQRQDGDDSEASTQDENTPLQKER